MSTNQLKSCFLHDPRVESIVNVLKNDAAARVQITGICGSSGVFIVSSVFEKSDFIQVVILNDKEEAAYFHNDLEQIAGSEKVFFFPSSYRSPYNPEKTDNANVLHRAEVLNAINRRTKPFVIVTYPEAMSEKVVSQAHLSENTLTVSKGEKLSTEFVNELLIEYGFEKVDFVAEPGQFAVRGGIVDVFSYANEYPYRIEMWGDTVGSIRVFDAGDQLSLQNMQQITIIPNIQGRLLIESRQSFLQYVPKSAVLWFSDYSIAEARIMQEYKQASDAFDKLNAVVQQFSPDKLFLSQDNFKKDVATRRVIEFGRGNQYPVISEEKNRLPITDYSSESGVADRSPTSVAFNQLPQPAFSKNFDLLIENLKQNKKEGYTTVIVASNAKQVERIYEILRLSPAHLPVDGEGEIQVLPFGEDLGGASSFLLPLHEGFIDKDYKVACYTDHQIFERYHRFRLKEGYHRAKQSLTIKELTGLHKGDYVTHIDFGIGQFDGLEKLEVNGKHQEALRIRYKDGDTLYVSIHSLHRIAKYTGKEGEPPKIHKLGSNAWQNLKQKAKKRIKEIAFDLVKLYARRKAAQGFAFSPDTYMQTELEASFIYEDTPDQLKSTEDVKRDMELPMPMDRLICGDVGFGKTEIAIRAAFKAVADNKQVAVLAPTTILTLQHYKTFSERLKEFPCSVDYINRFKSAKQQKETLIKIKEGKTDILIGTHRVLSKDIRFKNLGLLIVDEEQKFGVGAKDKLKTLKENVDTLTLTATPIPRTLQFSLMGARDLSMINTPPPNRYPIQTEVHTFSEEIVRDAVSYEISRGGQVFFVHNRISNIQEVAGMIQRLCPDVRIGIAHGQMEGKKLEAVMMRFIEDDFDVLVCTAIVESGLDISNANTIIVNDAHKFGLSDLHQLRGRVGRTNKRAFCYLFCPPLSSLSSDSRRRLAAIEQFSDLGSGMHIALRDLDIRGAGNLLGGEQSGFIAEIGYETYQKILDEAMEELREESLNTKEDSDFKNQISETGAENKQQPETGNQKPVNSNLKPEIRNVNSDCQVDTDLEIMLPDNYVNNHAERLSLYKELSDVKNEEELGQFENNLGDRFGPIPNPSLALLNTIRLRWLARDIGFTKLILKNKKLIGYFPGNPNSSYYQSPLFAKIMNYLHEHPQNRRLKERDNRLSLIIEYISGVEEAITVLKPMLVV